MRNKSLIRRACAFACAGIMIFGLAGCASGPEQAQKAGKEETVQLLSYQVVTPDYPEQVPCPDIAKYGDDWDAYQKACNAWRESRSKQAPQEADLSGIALFTAKTMAPVLSGGGTENRVYAPLNIYLALAMTAELTDGDSRSQLLDVLGVPDMDALRGNAEALWKGNYRDDGAGKCVLSSSVWMSDSWPFRSEALQSLGEVYGASAFAGDITKPDFGEALGQWLDAATGGMLTEQTKDVVLDPGTILALATAVCYEAGWQEKFSPELNYTDVFRTADGETETEYMYMDSHRDYYRGENFGAVMLNTSYDAGMMWLVLPDEGTDADALLQDPDVVRLVTDGWKNDENGCGWEDCRYTDVELSVPKFDAVSETELPKILQGLGVTDIFDKDAADFSPLTDAKPVWVSDILHAARVKIDEEGVSAAAFTVEELCGAGETEERVEMKLDRPFLFVLTGSDGVPLFAGLINSPAN